MAKVTSYDENGEVMDSVKCKDDEIDKKIEEMLFSVNWDLSRIEVESKGKVWNPI